MKLVTEGRMKGKPTRGGRIQMLHDLAYDGDCVAQLRTER